MIANRGANEDIGSITIHSGGNNEMTIFNPENLQVSMYGEEFNYKISRGFSYIEIGDTGIKVIIET